MAQIKTFARLKPTKKAYTGYEIKKNVLTVHIPDSKDFVIVKPVQAFRSNISYDIIFTDIFSSETPQEEVFNGVAKDIIQNFLNGYNGTIFAYGQTGTGKTYTVEGNACKYKTRGLATRALSMIYQHLENRTDEHISVYLSYLEIYQEVAYDLLNPAARTLLPMAPFSKVTVVEGPQGTCILRGLSLHLAANEEIAQMLLLQGQANRKVAETPVNQRSSRSHAVFTVYLQARHHDSEILLSSKLHLVDLAGSERVSKTGVDGQQLTEAKSINLSLHHLETVIIALQCPGGAAGGAGADRSKAETDPSHSRSTNSFMSGPTSEGCYRSSRYIPYRNSLLTMVLKDSLGGNCLTAMIATISLEPENLGESISTCRFAQRVARIANNAKRNEEMDDKTLIRKLKHKVARLENQVALLRAKGQTESSVEDALMNSEIMDLLSEEDRLACATIMEGFLRGLILDPIAAGICNTSKFRECLHLLKDQYCTFNDERKTDGSEVSQSTEQGAMSNLLLPNSNKDSGDHVTHISSANMSQSGGEIKALAGAKLAHDLCHNEPARPKVPHRASSSNSEVSVLPSHASFDISVAGQAFQDQDKQAIETGTSLGMEKKADGISQLLQVLGKDKYRSPYERKQEKEIKRLGRKLETMEEEQSTKQEQLQKMKNEAAKEQLLAAASSMRLKLQVAEEQVADQNTYLLQLKHLDSDSELIAREQLVKGHLMKRQAKFKEKLEEILKAYEQLKHAPQDPTEAQKTSTGLEEKFGQFKQAKGSLNTRQVFDMLKKEANKQKKENQTLERETVVMKARQLAMKEEATVEKLRELKMMLKMSQLKDEVSGGLARSVDSYNEGTAKDSSFYQQSQAWDPETNGAGRMSKEPPSPYPYNGFHPKDNVVSQNYLWPPSMDERDLAIAHGPSDLREEPHSSGMNQQLRIPGHHSYRQNERGQQPASKVNHDQWVVDQVFSDSSSVPLEDNASSSDVGLSERIQKSLKKQEEARVPHDPLLDAVPKHVFNDIDEGGIGAMSSHSPRHSHKFAFADPVKDSSSPLRPDVYDLNGPRLNSNSSCSGFTEYADMRVGNRNLSQNNADSKPMIKKDPSFSVNDHDAPLLVSDLEESLEAGAKISAPNSVTCAQQPNQHQVNGTTNGIEVSLSNAESAAPTRDISEPRFFSSRKYQEPMEPVPKHVVPPSEYINSMSSREKFDARKMGLSSRTFESALSHMLETGQQAANAPTLPYTVDPYEKYCRDKSPSPPRADRHSRHLRRSKSPVRKAAVQQQKEGDTSVPKPALDPRSTWGPDTKNASVAERLAGLLDLYSDSHPTGSSSTASSRVSDSKHQQHRKRVSKSKERVDKFQTRLAQYERDGEVNSGSEEDSFFGNQPAKTPIRAMTQEEGERTYLSRIAAEKDRVSKIRKARDAAELIQKHWRTFQASK